MATQDYPGIWAMEAFRRGGVDTDRLARQHPTEVAGALADPGGLDYRAVDILLNSCAEMTGNQSFGLHMIDYCDLAMYGTHGFHRGRQPLGSTGPVAFAAVGRPAGRGLQFRTSVSGP